jgi:hypothetical protein
LGLSTVTVGKGVDEIGEEAFAWCKSLQCIVIPNAVKWIHEGAFKHCWKLTTVTLSNGLEEIKKKAFEDCRLLEHIVIPPAVKAIDDSAFKGCSNLTHVEFCKKIEQFVSCKAMRDWWNQGLHEKTLSTYCFLVKSNIPDQLGLVQVKIWQANIYDMLRCIPSIPTIDSMEAKLSLYENLEETPALLKLAIWKSIITKQLVFGGSNGNLTYDILKMQCSADSLTMVRRTGAMLSIQSVQ